MFHSITFFKKITYPKMENPSRLNIRRKISPVSDSELLRSLKIVKREIVLTEMKFPDCAMDVNFFTWMRDELKGKNLDFLLNFSFQLVSKFNCKIYIRNKYDLNQRIRICTWNNFIVCLSFIPMLESCGFQFEKTTSSKPYLQKMKDLCLVLNKDLLLWNFVIEKEDHVILNVLLQDLF